MTTLVWHPVEVIERQIELLETGDLGLQDVYYGDQQKIPRTPCATVEAGTQNNLLAGAPFRVEHDITTYIVLYIAKVTSNQVSKREADLLSAAVTKRLHEDKTMGGLVVYGLVTRIEPGFAQRGELMQAVRITWTGLSKTNQ